MLCDRVTLPASIVAFPNDSVIMPEGKAPCVRIEDDPGRPGQKVLIATRDISPGETMFEEPPLILAKAKREPEEVCHASSSKSNVAADIT